MSTDATDKISRLSKLVQPPAPPEAAPGSDVAPDLEVHGKDLEPVAADPNERPRKRFKWTDESSFNLESLLASTTAATIEVISTDAGSMSLTFREWTEEEKHSVEATIAPKANSRKHFFLDEQVGRQITLGLIAVSIVKWDGNDWMRDEDDIDARMKALLEGRGVAMIDCIVRAWAEFQEHLIWLAGTLDPKR